MTTSHKAWNTDEEYPSWVSKPDTKNFHGKEFHSVFSKKVRSNTSIGVLQYMGHLEYILIERMFLNIYVN